MKKKIFLLIILLIIVLIRLNSSFVCEKGKVYSEERKECIIVDRDLDSVMDDKDKCLDTTPLDLVNLDEKNKYYGCSCSQGALKVKDPNTGVDIFCWWCFDFIDNFLIDWGFKTEKNHCHNGVKDCNEFGVDCGLMSGCKPCSFNCELISEQGSLEKVRTLKIGIFPKGYLPITDLIDGNYDKWKKRANFRYQSLIKYPPFNKEKISFYRIDYFLNGYDFKKIPLEELEKIIYELRTFCNGLDIVIIENLEKNEEEEVARLGESWYFTNFNIIYNDESEGLLAHEIGHSFCGLVDEYNREVYDYELKEISFNCDPSPEEKNGKLICIWDPEHSLHFKYNELFKNRNLVPKSFPDAGCTLGCGGGKNYNNVGRPTNLIDPSIMGESTNQFNLIGHEVCSQYVDKYSQ